MTPRRAKSPALPKSQQRLVSTTCRAIRAELVRIGDPSLARGAKRFSKEPIKCYGVNAPTAKEIAGRHRKELRHARKKHTRRLRRRLLRG